MGEAPAFVVDELRGELTTNGFHPKPKGHETTLDIGTNLTYFLGLVEDESGENVLALRIFVKSTGEWIIPTVLGTKPEPSNSFSAINLDEDRILIVTSGTSAEESFWFLEVNTPFVRHQKARIGRVVVAWSKGETGEAQKPIVISGPSGVGKGTLISKLMEENPSMFGFSVSHTTRGPRRNEHNGVHYHFTERSTMERDIEEGRFLEFASVHGNLYGTSVEAVDAVADEGKRCILDIDVQGARSVRTTSLEAVFIFVSPPSSEELEKRLRARGTETEEQIQKRLRNAKAELEQGSSPGLFDHVLVNDDLEKCYEELKKLLGLADAVKNAPKSGPDSVSSIPLEPAISKIGKKIIIKNDTVEKEDAAAAEMFVLDLSSIKGGAPGRTRGLKLSYAEEEASNP